MTRETENPVVESSIFRRLAVGSAGLGLAALLTVTACNDIAPPFTIDGTGEVEGLVFFDASEDGIFDPSDGDFAVQGVGIAVRRRGTEDVLSGGSTSSDAGGRFSLTGLPVGTHDMQIDTLTVPAGMAICQNPLQVSVFVDETRFSSIAGRPGCLITIAEAKELPLGSFVVVRGVVTAAPGQVETSNSWIEDATAGAHIFSGALDAAGLSVGDQIEIGATTGQFSNDFELLSVILREVVPGFDPSPTPLVVTTAEVAASGADFTDPIQGAFIRIEAVEFVGAFGTTPGGNSQNGAIDDGSGGAIIRVDDGVANRNDLNTIFTVGTCYNLQGFGANFAGSGQIFLRSLDPADFEEVACN